MRLNPRDESYYPLASYMCDKVERGLSMMTGPSGGMSCLVLLPHVDRRSKLAQNICPLLLNKEWLQL